MNYDNVIIFGAGASFDAGIPMLNNFVDTMWSLSIRGRSNLGPLSAEDKELFRKADKIRIELERYNSRANFRLRNLEDVLSLLSLEAMGGADAKANYDTWVNAITRTIELTTRLQKPDGSGPLEVALKCERTLYHNFWELLLGQHGLRNIPALITFNYDLVFERSLWDCFHRVVENRASAHPIKSCKIKYFLKPYDFTIKGTPCEYIIERTQTPAEAGFITTRTISKQYDGIRPIVEYYEKAEIEIPYLKLHGSLNWCSKTTPKQDEPIPPDLRPALRPTSAVDTPLILPPVFNKMNTGSIIPVWAKALEILRQAKHLIFVGYSLPRTDIYMQYFLKSAVGPNSSLQRIIVFDPVLFRSGEDNAEMRRRFQECFSPQFQEQIIFEPEEIPVRGDTITPGTFNHFVRSLRSIPKSLLFEA